MENSMPEEHHNKLAFTIKLSQGNLIGRGVVIILLLVIGILSIRARARSTNQSSDTDGVLLVITNSGSTNTPRVTLTVHKDGRGVVTIKGQQTEKIFDKGTFDISRLEHLLTQINDVSTIPNHACIKSVSFGSTTTITYKGKTSGDLSCLSNQDPKPFQDVATLVRNIYESNHIQKAIW